MIRLREHGGELVVELGADVASGLAVTGLVDVVPAGTGRWRLCPGDRVGAVSVGDLDVVVEPKIGTGGVLFLLGYAADPGFRPEDVEGAEADDLLPVVAESLARQVERATARGVLQGYVTLDEALPVVRGRLRAADQMARRPGMLLPIEVRFDEYSANIPENRIIRSAVRRMMAVPRVRQEIRQRLGHLDGRLDGVTPLVAGETVPGWRATRLNKQYVPALRLSEMVLRHVSAESGEAGLSVASFVVDMAKVFEDFVTTALREAMAGLPGRTESQYSVDLAVGGGVPMRPDVVHVVGGRAVAVFDAKYKIERGGRVPNADVYQMLAYCTALELGRGYLVYAKGGGEPMTHRVVRTDPSIEIVQLPLSLDESPSDVLAQVERLATGWVPRASRQRLKERLNDPDLESGKTSADPCDLLA